MIPAESIAFDLTSLRKIWKSDMLDSELIQMEDFIKENPLLNETLLLRRSSLAIIDLRKMQYVCTFGDVEGICGWSKEIILREGVVFFVSKFLSPDYSGLEKMSEIMTQYVAGLSVDRIIRFKSLFDFRMVGKDGEVRRIIQEGVALRRDADGNILFLLALITDITNLKRDGRQHLRLTDGVEELLYEVNNAAGSSRRLESLSTRELEIAKLIGRNFSSKDIAKSLFLSPHTVNTHRQNMLRKLDMEDTMELINFLHVYQLI